jgi:TldD protein
VKICEISWLVFDTWEDIMKKFAKDIVDSLSAKRVEYGDVRVVEKRSESMGVKNGKVDEVYSSDNIGFGVRVLVNGAWGFAASARMGERDEADRIVSDAIRIAKASSRVMGEKVRLSHVEPVTATYRINYEKDPFKVPLDQKVQLLLDTVKIMQEVKGVKVASGSLFFLKTNKVFASTEGALIDQEIIESGGGIQARAVKGGEVQTRSYPSSHGGSYATRGFEHIEAFHLVEEAPRVAEEAVKLLTAKECPSELTTVIIDSNQMALQVHESIGHPVELDRVLGMEASYAGTSFVTLDKLGTFRYGSPLVNVTADATCEGGLGTFGFDDEGVPAQKMPIIREGIFEGYLSSRETATTIGRQSSGAMRADGWSRIPLIRMTNINLEPGEGKLEKLIGSTEEGILFSTNKSWSIDDKRLNFQFGCEVAYRINKGKIGDLYKNSLYTGITPQFWNSCDAVCGLEDWKLWGIPNCGKGEPGQSAHVGHGTSPARFRNVQVGIKK